MSNKVFVLFFISRSCIQTEYMFYLAPWRKDIEKLTVTNQEIPDLLWNMKFHYHVCKSLPLDPTKHTLHD